MDAAIAFFFLWKFTSLFSLRLLCGTSCGAAKLRVIVPPHSHIKFKIQMRLQTKDLGLIKKVAMASNSPHNSIAGGPTLEHPSPKRKQEPGTHFGVSFRNLHVHGFFESTFYQHTFASALCLLPALLRHVLFAHSRGKVQILRGFDGVVQRGEMLLVLGRPGSGCSTLLKTIAGDVHGITVDDESALNYGGEKSDLSTISIALTLLRRGHIC